MNHRINLRTRQGRAVDPKLALTQAALVADAGEGEGGTINQQEEFADMSDEEFEESLATLAEEEEEPLPDYWAAFRRRARINTYTVLSPALAIDDYPGGEGQLQTYPIVFGVNGHRVRTVTGDG